MSVDPSSASIAFVKGEDAVPGAKQHFLPASLIGRFSEEHGKGSARSRKVWVRDRHNSRSFKTAAQNVATENAIYGTGAATNDVSKTIDYIWSIYEPGLPRALNAISGKTESIDGILWAQVLVPFRVRSLCTRSGFCPTAPGEYSAGNSSDRGSSLYQQCRSGPGGYVPGNLGADHGGRVDGPSL
jgi:hypothetical protein